jgi:hypothetical protein
VVATDPAFELAAFHQDTNRDANAMMKGSSRIGRAYFVVRPSEGSRVTCWDAPRANVVPSAWTN